MLSSVRMPLWSDYSFSTVGIIMSIKYSSNRSLVIQTDGWYHLNKIRAGEDSGLKFEWEFNEAQRLSYRPIGLSKQPKWTSKAAAQGEISLCSKWPVRPCWAIKSYTTREVG